MHVLRLPFCDVFLYRMFLIEAPQHFLVPMQERIGDLFQEQDVKELFCNIDTLWEVNSMFLASLEQEDVHFEMGKIFLRTVSASCSAPFTKELEHD